MATGLPICACRPSLSAWPAFWPFRGILLGLTKGTTVPLESQGLVMIGQAYLPMYMFGNMLGAASSCCSRAGAQDACRAYAQHGLSVAPLWQDACQAGVSPSVIIGFVYTLNQYEGIPVPVLVTLIILGVFSFIANKTVFGRRIYSIGSNVEATRLSGVNVRMVKMMVFGMMGLMCAFAGLTTTARLAAGSPSAGNSANSTRSPPASSAALRAAVAWAPSTAR
jgi:D-xylose transport system permease protein